MAYIVKALLRARHCKLGLFDELQARDSNCVSRTHCKENPIYVLPGKKLRGLSSNFHIHVSVSDLYFPTSVHLFSCSRIGSVPYLGGPLVRVLSDVRTVSLNWEEV